MGTASFCSTSHAIAALTDARERARKGLDTSAAQEEAVTFILERCGQAEREQPVRRSDPGSID